MQMESRVMTALHAPKRESSGVKANHPPRAADPHRLDDIAASIVIGLTAIFVATIFGVVTNFIPTLLITFVIGSFIGASSGAIAYIIMRN